MKVILFGSTGMLGAYIYNVLKQHYNIICITRSEYDIMKYTWSQLYDILIPLLNENDVIINSIGVIPQKSMNLRENIKVNSIFPYHINQICKQKNCKYIHITTDCVYSGKKGLYENDEHDADTIYGITKSLGEYEDSTIIRTSIIGEESYGKKSLLEWIISNKNKEINGYNNHYWNGVTCLTLAKLIHEIIHENKYWKGVKNVCSEEIVTKLQLCQYINDIYDLNLKINSIEMDYKNMSLKYNPMFRLDSIYQQIKDQKDYKSTKSADTDT